MSAPKADVPPQTDPSPQEQTWKILQELPVFLYGMDEDLRCTWVCNTPGGTTENDFVGKTPEEFFSDVEEDHLQMTAQSAIETGDPQRSQFTVTLNDRRHVLDAVMIPSFDGAGNIQGFLGGAIDRTSEHQTDEQFQRFVEEVEEYAIFMLDPGGHIVTWNEGARKIKGYEADEILSHHFSIFYTPEARASGHPQDLLAQASREGYVVREGWRVRNGGDQFWARVTITAMHDESGTLHGYLKVVRDLTEQRRQEQELRQSEQKYRRLFEQAQEGISISTPDGQIIDVNPAVEQMLGYTLEELRTMEIQSLYVDPQAREEFRQNLVENEGAQRQEISLRRKDGREIICQVSSTPWREPNGEITAYQSFFRDITAQKEAFEALRNSEERFRTVAECALVGIALVQDGTFRYVNPMYGEILGYAPGEMIGRSPELVVHPDDWPRVSAHMERRLEGKTDTARYTFRGQTKSGDLRYLEVFGGLIDYRGAPAVIGTVRDITDRRRLQRRVLQIQEEERQRIGRELHDGIASHLSGASMILSGLIKDIEAGDPPGGDQLREIQQTIKDCAGQARKLSHGLMPGSVDQGNLPQGLQQLAERTRKQSTLDCRYEGLEEIPENIPEEILTHLYRIAQEGTSNAMTHANADHLWIRLSMSEEEIVLCIEDDGIGLSEDTTSGEGIGLQTMRYRAELLGGSLTVAGPSGEGTELMVRMPKTARYSN